jgi:hypothetical protein
MANQYKVEKGTQFNGLNVYLVRNKATGKVKYAMYTRYNAEDLCKYANGRPGIVNSNCLGGPHPGPAGTLWNPVRPD